MTVEATVRITLKSDPARPGAFGHGCAQLLEGVREERSLNKAAKRLGMAYSKAWRIVHEAEEQIGVDLLARDGARGSTLTESGEALLDSYLELQGELDALAARRVPSMLEDVRRRRP